MLKKLLISGIGVLLIVLGVWLWVREDKTEGDQLESSGSSIVEEKSTEENSSSVQYVNNEYGFRFTLPESWEGYSIIEDIWEGYSISAEGSGTLLENGPKISIRYPNWDYKSPRQDIPILVFTINQWNDLSAERFGIGSAPVPPTELGRNKKYVFALPARYNYAFITGYEEVEEILSGSPLKAF